MQSFCSIFSIDLALFSRVICFLLTPPFPSFSNSGLMPPKRSRGKPALSRVPFLDSVNGDSDYSSSGEKGCVAHPAPLPAHT